MTLLRGELFSVAWLIVHAKQNIIQPEHKYNKHADPCCQTNDVYGILLLARKSLLRSHLKRTVDLWQKVENYVSNICYKV